MKKLRLYKYRGQDPIIAETLALIDGETLSAIAKRSGTGASTLSNWRRKRTKTARFDTLQNVGRSVGMTLKWTRTNS